MKIKFDTAKLRRGATVAALAASMPMVMATSAQATERLVPLGCTVTTGTPKQSADDYWTGANQVNAIVKVKCPAGRVVLVDQYVHETPAGPSTELARTTHYFIFYEAGTQTGSLNGIDVPNTAGTEKVLQRVKGSVHTLDNIPGGSFKWITSDSVLIS